MSEIPPEGTPPAAGAPPEGTPPPAASPPQDLSALPEWARESIAKANAEAARYRTQLREVEPLAKRAQELEDANKTEVQRLTEALATERQGIAAAQADATRFRVAALHGITTAEDLDLLGSGDEATITARAVNIAAKNAAVAAAAAAKTPPPPGGGRSVENLTPGASDTGVLSEDDVLYNSLFPPRK